MKVWETRIARIYGERAKPSRAHEKIIFEDLTLVVNEWRIFEIPAEKGTFYHKL